MPLRLFVRPRIVPLVLLALALPSFSVAQSILSASTASSAPQTAEVGMPVLESYPVKEFNPEGQVWTIVQGRRGVIYFGMSGGWVLEYDGVSWRKIDTAMSIARSLAIDDSGKIWVGGNGGFGYLAPDAVGTLHYVSLLDQVPETDRSFTDVWQTLIAPQGVFFRSSELLFRWDGKNMHVWRPESGSRFQALSLVRGHIYTAQSGIGLQEIVGDELRSLPGGGGL